MVRGGCQNEHLYTSWNFRPIGRATFGPLAKNVIFGPKIDPFSNRRKLQVPAGEGVAIFARSPKPRFSDHPGGKRSAVRGPGKFKVQGALTTHHSPLTYSPTRISKPNQLEGESDRANHRNLDWYKRLHRAIRSRADSEKRLKKRISEWGE
jgi:hypothetical protein